MHVKECYFFTSPKRVTSPTWGPPPPCKQALSIQVFRERLSEKVHATTPKGIVGSFECPVLQRNLKELHGRPRTYVCECQRKVKKLVSTATVVRNSVLIISHITFGGCRVHIFSDNLSRNSCIHPSPPGSVQSPVLFLYPLLPY